MAPDLIQLGAHRLELGAHRLRRVGQARGHRRVGGPSGAIGELRLQILHALHVLHDLVDPVDRATGRRVLCHEVGRARGDSRVCLHEEATRERVRADDQPDAVFPRRHPGTAQRPVVDHGVGELRGRFRAQVPDEAVGAGARAHQRVRWLIRDAVRGRGGIRAGEGAEHRALRIHELELHLPRRRPVQPVVHRHATRRVLPGAVAASSAVPEQRRRWLEEMCGPPRDAIRELAEW